VLVALYLLLPFIRIKGESAFRFDVASLKLHIFGTSIWMQDFFIVLLTIIFLASFFLLLTLLLGRIWCGWACPQTVFCDLTRDLVRTAEKNGLFGKIKAHLTMIAIAGAIGFVTIGYFVSVFEMVHKAVHWELGGVSTVSILVIAVLTYLHLTYIRTLFCATICPYGKIQGALTDSKSLIIHLDPDRRSQCLDCKACLNACPTGLDIREGMQAGCIMCAECVDACNTVMAKKQTKGLVQYNFGSDTSPISFSQLARPAILILSVVTVFMGSILTYQIASRSLFAFSILPHPMGARLTKEGGVVNGYILSIKNKSKKDMSFLLDLIPEEKTIAFSHSVKERLQVAAGIVEKYPLFIRSEQKPPGDTKVAIKLYDSGNKENFMEKSVYFLNPYTE